MSEKPCPSCGYCPTCKRRNVQPYIPYQPQWLYPGPTIWCQQPGTSTGFTTWSTNANPRTDAA